MRPATYSHATQESPAELMFASDALKPANPFRSKVRDTKHCLVERFSATSEPFKEWYDAEQQVKNEDPRLETKGFAVPAYQMNTLSFTNEVLVGSKEDANRAERKRRVAECNLVYQEQGKQEREQRLAESFDARERGRNAALQHRKKQQPQQEREQRKAETQKPRKKTIREMWTVEQENFQTHLLRTQTAEQKAAQENRARSTKAQRERVHQRLTKHPSEARQGLSAESYQQIVREVDLHNAKKEEIEQDKVMRKNPAKQEKAQQEHEQQKPESWDVPGQTAQRSPALEGFKQQQLSRVERIRQEKIVQDNLDQQEREQRMTKSQKSPEEKGDLPLNSIAGREKATQDRLDERMKALPEAHRIRETPFITNVIASKANAAGLSNRQVLDTSRGNEMLKRNAASRKIEIDGLKKFAKGFKLNTLVPADILLFLGKGTATQAPATLSAPSPSCHFFMEQLCKAEYRHWTVRKSGSRPLWSDTLHARFLSLDTKGSVKLQVSPKTKSRFLWRSWLLGMFYMWKKERIADVLGEQILIVKDMLHTRYMELEAWKLELEADSNDAKRASEVTDVKVGEAREKATEENITIPAGKAADSGTFVLILVLKPLEKDLSEISKEDEDFIQNAKSEDRRRTLRELIERRLGQITATKKDAHIDQNANLEDIGHKMRASVDRAMDQMWEESDKSPAQRRVLQGARLQVLAMMKEELDAMRVDVDVAAQKVEPEDVMQEVALEIEQDFDEMYDVSDSDSDSNGWAEIKKEDEVETEQVWEVGKPAFDEEEFEKVSQVGQEEEEEEEVVVVVVEEPAFVEKEAEMVSAEDKEEEEFEELVEDDEWHLLAMAEIDESNCMREFV
ncbi:hypothetical protein OEA41_009547 [Lepraria neglecta]|uniref:Uncharacterized protein n=1 Tax=Lepraria neglecta TaxID=209136 RepID=A0AAD9Z280_9LECA|nr:hypothetical protein OEA41_009547 [Lepraria neglecta]